MDERVAAGGMPALLEIVRERVLGLEVDPLARAAALGMAAPGARVDELGAALGVSERQLRRRFADAVGYGPKTLARILRFQRFLTLAADGGELARLALPAGYADQAHLTRETRRLSGRTPLRAPRRRRDARRRAPRARAERRLSRAVLAKLDARVADSFKPRGPG